MKRVALCVGLVAFAAVGFAQPPGDPMPPPPRVLPPSVATPPMSPVVPAAGTRRVETPLIAFEPLAAFPQPTQQAVRAALHGSSWLTRMNQPQGRFVFGYLPALRQTMEGDHDLKQAHAALAMARSAKFTGDDRQTAVASQAILALMAATKIDPADANCRVPVHSSVMCNRAGFAAILALAVYELPSPDERLVAEAEKLCAFLQKQLRSDGSVHYTDNPADVPTQVDPAGVNEHPGYALQAIVTSNRTRPVVWKLEAAKKGAEFYRGAFKAAPHPMLAATMTPALAELYQQTKDATAAAAAFEMNDWLAALQIAPTDPKRPMWAGGFRGWANGQPVDVAPGFETGVYLQCLSCACKMTREVPDLQRFGRYRQAALDAAQYLSGLQYTEGNTRHFADTFRANTLIGGFYLSPTDGNLRIDATACCVSGLLQFLGSGAEK